MPHHTPIPHSDQPPIQPVLLNNTNSNHSNIPPEAVILLDWDDTLLCSSYLQENNFTLSSVLYDLNRPLEDSDSDEIKRSREIAIQLKELENGVITLLKQATAFAVRTVILTNAEIYWVELSAAKFLPTVVPYLTNVTIISARSAFEHLFPQSYGMASMVKWKYLSMVELLVGSGFLGRIGVEKHIISLGDSHVEREAVLAVTRGVPNTITKSVKFSDRPTSEQLHRQLELVNQCFAFIASHQADLDLQLTVTINSQQAEQKFNVNNSDASVLPSKLVNETLANLDPPIEAEKLPITEPDLLTSEVKDEPVTEETNLTKAKEFVPRLTTSTVV